MHFSLKYLYVPLNSTKAEKEGFSPVFQTWGIPSAVRTEITAPAKPWLIIALSTSVLGPIFQLARSSPLKLPRREVSS